MELSGLNAVVTGGSRGLGSAIVDVLHGAGARVVSADITPPQDGTGDHRPGHPIFIEHDVRETQSWYSLVERVHSELGRIDILVNNAGIGMRKDLLTTTDQEWENVLRTNLWGPWTGLRVFVDDLTASEHAAVVNIGSIYGVTTPPGHPAPPSSVAYQVSKAGLHMLTKSAAVELAPHGIRVNAVLPGVFITPLLEDLTEDQREARIMRAPMERAGDPVDVAHAVLYLTGLRPSPTSGAGRLGWSG